MEDYRDLFRFVVELTDRKGTSVAYFVLAAACTIAHSHRVRLAATPQHVESSTPRKAAAVSPPVPSEEKGNAQVSTIRIFYLDGSTLSINVQSETTIKDICAQICLEQKLGLYEVEQDIGPLNEQTLLPASMTVCELMSRWREFRWDDAKLVAPVYLKDWAYRLNNRALRQVRFDNSYLTQVLEYDATGDHSQPNQPVTTRRQRLMTAPTSPSATPHSQSFEAHSSSLSTGLASTRARERTHALLNALFTTREDNDPRHWSTAATELSWERSLRRGHATARRSTPTQAVASTPSSALSSTSSPTPAVVTMAPPGTQERTPTRPSPATSSPLAPLPVAVAAAVSTPEVVRGGHSNASINQYASPSTPADTSSTSAASGTRAETPDKIRPRTTVVHLPTEHRSRTPSPNPTGPAPVPASGPGSTAAPVPAPMMMLSAAASPVPSFGSPTSPAMSTVEAALMREEVHSERSSPATTCSTMSTHTASHHQHQHHAQAATITQGTISSTTRFMTDASDLAIHTAHARTNALLARLFGTFPENAKDSTTVPASAEKAATSVPATETDDATPARRALALHSPHSSGTLTLSRSTSPGAHSVSSTVSSTVQSPGGTLRRRLRTPKSPVERPPFDASTSGPTLSMLLALGRGAALTEPRIVLDKEGKGSTEGKDTGTEEGDQHEPARPKVIKVRPYPLASTRSSAKEDTTHTDGEAEHSELLHTPQQVAHDATIAARGATSDIRVRLFSRRGSTGSTRTPVKADSVTAKPRRGSTLSTTPSTAQTPTPSTGTTPSRSLLQNRSPRPLPATAGTSRTVSPYTTTLRGSITDRSHQARLTSPSPASGHHHAPSGRGTSPHSTTSGHSSGNEHSHPHTTAAPIVAFMRSARPDSNQRASVAPLRGRSTSPHSTISGNSGTLSRQGSARRPSRRGSVQNWIP